MSIYVDFRFLHHSRVFAFCLSAASFSMRSKTSTMPFMAAT